MTAAIHDFKSIANKLSRQEQKIEWDEKNPIPSPPAWYNFPVSWSPEHGYSAPESDPA